ncbi:MAG TPA: alpha/beta hydrolase [Mycobacterium sp.]|nr:alpha/beta hydrolase [Mycobacterium sp.]
MRRMSSALLVALQVIAVVGIAGEAGASPEPGVDASSATPGRGWGSCTPFVDDISDIPAARCTMVTVPVDYQRPAGEQAQLAVIRIPASGQRLGSLLVNPGGPGASAVAAAAGLAGLLADSEITRHFDLVGFDPRGVGHSTPALRCRTDAEFDAYRRDPQVDFSPAGVAHIEGLNQQVARACADRIGTSFLASVGTVSAARDMDVVRQALGDEQLNYLGFSYGTRLGTAYLEQFGDHVRAMVLDGAIDPTVSPIEHDVNQMAGFQQVFNDYATDCARSPRCPLGADPAQAVSAYRRLVDPLVATPGQTIDPRGLSYGDAITGTVNALYNPRYWTYLTSGLRGLQRGTDADDLLVLADDYLGRDEDGHYAGDQDAFDAIRCVDAPRPSDPASWADADRRIRQAAPFLSYGTFTGNAPRDLCVMWPVPATSAPHTTAPAAPGKAVVVSTTHDPATPYQAGVALARQLQAPLISYEGTQHTVVFEADRCVDDTVQRYLITGVAPPVDARC